MHNELGMHMRSKMGFGSSHFDAKVAESLKQEQQMHMQQSLLVRSVFLVPLRRRFDDTTI